MANEDQHLDRVGKTLGLFIVGFVVVAALAILLVIAL